MSNTVHGVASHKDSTSDVHGHHPTLTRLYAMQHSNNHSLCLQVIGQFVPNIHEKHYYNVALYSSVSQIPPYRSKKENKDVVGSKTAITPVLSTAGQKLQQYFHGVFALLLLKLTLNLLHHFSRNPGFRYSD
jgi:hypothetical protein